MFNSVDIVGNRFLRVESVVELLKIVEEKSDLFTNFPIGATIQDGGKRKRRRWLGNQWQWIFILNSEYVEVLVVLYQV